MTEMEQLIKQFEEFRIQLYVTLIALEAPEKLHKHYADWIKMLTQNIHIVKANIDGQSNRRT